MDVLKPNSANSSPLTPLGFLERASTVYGDCASIVYNETTFTWSQTYRRCLQIASAISSLGIRRGQVVSVFAPNIPAMYELHFAVPMAGAILNTINVRLDARTISILLRHGKSELIFVDSLSRSVLLEALSLFPPNAKRPALIFLAVDEDPSLTVDVNRTYEGFLKTGDPRFNWIRPENEWDPMILNYTSGTTSAPKGVVHCHRGIFIITVDSLIDWFVPKQPIYLWTLPMFHANGWSFPWGIAAVGGTNVCLRKFDAATIYDAITRHDVTHMCGAPVVLNMLANAPNRQALQNPVQVLTAGAPPPAAVLFRAESVGFVVSHGYGLTETAGLVVSCTWKREWNRFPATEQARLKARQGVRTAGMAEVDVLDVESGVSVKRDGSSLGEIVLRGGCIMLGYLNDPAGTARSIKNGWFYTGDVGVIHPDGYIEIKDRSKDVIISGGENLSSVEVESVLYTHPAINEAAVVARPDEFWGETPCAFVSLKPPPASSEKENPSPSASPSEKDIIEYCRAKMPHFMVPKTVVFTAELPKTSTGKIQKFVLRDMAKALGSSKLSRM